MVLYDYSSYHNPTELSYRIILPYLQFMTGTLRLTWDPQVKVTLRWTWVKVAIAYVHVATLRWTWNPQVKVTLRSR